MKRIIFLSFILLVSTACKKDPVIQVEETNTNKPFDNYKLEGNYSGEETLIQEHWYYFGGIIETYPWNKTSWDYTYDSTFYDAYGIVAAAEGSEISITADAIETIYPKFEESFVVDTLVYSNPNFEVRFVGQSGDSLFINAVTLHEEALESWISATGEYNYYRFETRFVLIKN